LNNLIIQNRVLYLSKVIHHHENESISLETPKFIIKSINNLSHDPLGIGSG
jgi:hypothetical protein